MPYARSERDSAPAVPSAEPASTPGALAAAWNAVTGAIGAVIALSVFAAMFSLSAFIIGPIISNDSGDSTPTPVQTSTPDEHGHHGD